MCSFFFISLLNIVYFKKERFNTLENKIYSYLILTSLFGTIIGVPCYYFMKYKEIFGVFNIITSKAYLVYLVMWLMIFTMYILLITVKGIDKNKLIKNIFIITIILLVGVIILPLYYYNENGIVFSYGPSTNLMYIISSLFILIVIGCMIKNIKFLKEKKFIPMTAFLIVGTIIMIIQKLNPGLLLLTFGEAFITFLMYFTIENPDVKQMKELERNNEITEQSYIDKSNFIFEMTQEVREPLNYIKNTSKVLIDNNPTKDEYKEGLGYIYNASRQLDFVVNDVLNVSTLDVQKVKILNNRYNLDRLYEDLIKRVEPSINNNVKFRYSIPNNIPYLYGDNIKLKQVLYSLLMNAVKKTENGFIEFNVNTIEKYDVCRVIFRITDSGCGIGLEKINEILSVTGELNKEDIDNLEKSEFNIELCQKIIKSLGGNLLIKSKLGKGTEVILTIDQKIYREEEKIVNNNNYGTKKVLVVCQDKKIREIIKKVLNENEINGSYILYGLDAVDRIKSGKKYDYIIIEDEMKEINGYETIKKLKNLKEFKIPCIILLNENKEKIKKYYIKDGYSDYILTRELRNELKRIIDKY